MTNTLLEAFEKTLEDTTGDYGYGIHIQDDNTVMAEWLSGGMSGGSCWDDDDATYYGIDGDTAPHFDKFITASLIAFKSDIPLSVYMDVAGLIKDDTNTHNEWYGNYSIYSTRTLYLDQLEEILKKHDIIK